MIVFVRDERATSSTDDAPMTKQLAECAHQRTLFCEASERGNVHEKDIFALQRRQVEGRGTVETRKRRVHLRSFWSTVGGAGNAVASQRRRRRKSSFTHAHPHRAAQQRPTRWPARFCCCSLSPSRASFAFRPRTMICLVGIVECTTFTSSCFSTLMYVLVCMLASRPSSLTFSARARPLSSHEGTSLALTARCAQRLSYLRDTT